jgi:hypothetical protein
MILPTFNICICLAMIGVLGAVIGHGDYCTTINTSVAERMKPG